MSVLSIQHSWQRDSHRMVSWSAQSRVLLQGLTARLQQPLQGHIHPCCLHVKGHGGVKKAVRLTQRAIKAGRHVARLDIKHYYQSMQHAVIASQIKQQGVGSADRTMVQQALSLPDKKDSGVGICAGMSLAPLLGALYLSPLDELMRHLRRNKRIIAYVRYMDDYVIVCHKRWQLKRALVLMYRVLNDLGLQVHPDKRFIGRCERGFDFLGYQFQPGRKLRPSLVSRRRCLTNARRLYEREAKFDLLLQYLLAWQRWHFGGLAGLVSRQGGVKRTIKTIFYQLGIDRSAWPLTLPSA
jgi:RNA-directed DNA polymerase